MCSLTLEKTMFYPLVQNLLRCPLMVLIVSAGDFEGVYVQCVTPVIEPKFINTYGCLHLDFLLRSEILLFSFEFIAFSSCLLSIAVTIFIESCELGQALPVPTNLTFSSPKTLVISKRHNLHRFAKFFSR